MRKVKSFMIRSLYLSVLLIITYGCKTFALKIITKKDVVKDIITLENDQGRRIVYIGTIHLGKIGYYESVKYYVDSLRKADYKVLYEGIGGLDVTDSIQRKMRKVIGFHLTDYNNSENKSLKLPTSRLNYEEQNLLNTGIVVGTDIRADYTMDSLVLVYEKEYKPIQLTDCDWNTDLLDKYKCKDTVKHSKYHMVRTLRERKVIDVIKENKDQNIVLLYGRAHRFGIVGELKQLGFEIVEGKLRVL